MGHFVAVRRSFREEMKSLGDYNPVIAYAFGKFCFLPIIGFY